MSPFLNHKLHDPQTSRFDPQTSRFDPQTLPTLAAAASCGSVGLGGYWGAAVEGCWVVHVDPKPRAQNPERFCFDVQPCNLAILQPRRPDAVLLVSTGSGGRKSGKRGGSRRDASPPSSAITVLPRDPNREKWDGPRVGAGDSPLAATTNYALDVWRCF
jgi:hypothetical protein